MYVVCCDMISVCICESIISHHHMQLSAVLWTQSCDTVEHVRSRAARQVDKLHLFSLNQETYLTDFSKMCSSLQVRAGTLILFPGGVVMEDSYWLQWGLCLMDPNIFAHTSLYTCSYSTHTHTHTILISITCRSRNVGSCVCSSVLSFKHCWTFEVLMVNTIWTILCDCSSALLLFIITY